jgi:carboxypeptidase PM20D1
VHDGNAHVIVGIVVSVVVVVLAVLLVNTLRTKTRQIDVVPTPPIGFDETAATQRLAEAVRFKTVAPAKPDQLDAKPLLALHPFLRASFPGVHRALGREVVNDHSLLYAWPGTDATRKPISLMAHLDVVPVESAAEREWIEPLFSGRIADGYLGRGSTDDKSTVLGILEAVEARGRRCSAQPRMP